MELTLTLTEKEVAVLLLAVRELERNALVLGKPSPEQQRLQHRLLDLSGKDDISLADATDIARGLRQRVVSQNIEQTKGTALADKLDAQCRKLKGADLRNAVAHVLEQARLNADQTIRDEAAAHPARWNAIFIGSAESLLCDGYNSTAGAWFRRRGI